MSRNLEDKIIQSNKGKQKLAFEGYFYNFDKIVDNTVRWRCNKRGCNVFLKTTPGYVLVSDIPLHDHMKDGNKFDRVILKAKIKERALTTQESGRDIAVSLSCKAPHTVVDHKYMVDFVCKTRKKANFTPSQNYDIPLELHNTNKDRKFLFYDSGMEDVNRIVVFTTEENIEHFCYSNVVICDGTFKSCPSNFEQLYTIQCKVRQYNLPLVYCFMKNRSEASYNLLFSWLMGVCKDNCQPKDIILDFEVASWKSCKNFLPGSSIYGCVFHFGQIIWRRVQMLGFSKEFKENYEIRFQVKMILALSFVPPNEVTIIAARLKAYLVTEKSVNVLRLFEWFQENYLHMESNNKSIFFWNVYERVKKGIPRTSNSIEGYHRHLNSLVQTKQSSFLLIVRKLIDEQTVTEQKLLMSLHKNVTEKKDEPIATIVNDYTSYYGLEYLKKVVLNFNWKLD